MEIAPSRCSDEFRLVVCGAGAVGGNLVEHLARCALPASLAVIDHDRVEVANIRNQPYDVRQAGTSKVHALASRVFEACECRIDAIHATLDAASAPKLLRGAALVVDALDNAPSRLAVRDACLALKIPALHAGLARDGYVEVRGNDGYRIEQAPDGAGPCGEATTRSQVLLVVLLTAEAIRCVLAGESDPTLSATLATLCQTSRMP